MKKLSKIMMALILLMAMIVTPLNSVNAQFPDLTPMHWCYSKIMDFYERGYVDGYDDGTFLADDTITRAEYVKIVNNFFGYPKGNVEELEFSDLDGTEWFAPYVAEAVNKGYIEGYDDGTFKPQNPIRRQEATVILSRILKIHNEDYAKDHTDGMGQYIDGEEIDDWAYKAVHSYSVHNFINGYPDQTIRLKKNVTRAETVELLNLLEQKVEIDRPGGSGKKATVKKPIITVVEENNDIEWYNKTEAGEDELVTVQVHTDTYNAIITVEVDGITTVTRNVPVEKGTTVEFDLSDGKYQINANAVKKGSKPSDEADTKFVIVDTLAPIAEGKNTELGAKIEVIDPTTLTSDISGVDESSVKYAWFAKVVDAVSSEESYVRPTWSAWEALNDEVVLPEIAEPGEYYLGIMASDNAGNRTFGNIDKYLTESPEGGIPTINEGEDEYTIVIEKEKEDAEDPSIPGEEIPVIVKTKHTILFNAEENGTLEGKVRYENVEFGTSFSEIIVPVTNPNSGYSFASWNPELPEADSTIVADAEYLATWTINSYDLTINYEYEDGTEAAEPYETEVEYNKDYKVKSPEIEGYTPSIEVVTGTMTTDPVEVKVVYTKNKYDLIINYVYENGTEAAETYEAEVEYNEEYSVQSPSITGYTADRELVAGTMGTESVEVTVTYKVNSYDLTINYEYEDGTEAAEPYETEVEYNKDYKVKSPEIEGYTPSIEVVTGTMTTDPVEVKVVYTKNKYDLIINYVYENGTEAAETYEAEVEYNEEYSVQSPSITGYTADRELVAGTMGTESVEVTVTYKVNSYNLTINYVYEDESEAAEVYEDELEYNDEYSVKSPTIKGYTASERVVSGTMPAEDVEVTVTYTKDSYTLTINYVYEDGSEAAETYEDKIGYNEEYDIQSPTIMGYEANKKVVSGTMPDGDVEVKVTYTKENYTLTINYIYEDGSEAAEAYEDELEYNDEYSVKSPTIKGYKADKLVVNGTMPASNVEITVEYSANKYTVYFDEDGGVEVDDIINVSFDETVNVSEIKTTKTGYNFKGWKKGTTKITEFTMPDEDVTLKAEWEWIKPDIVIEKFVSTNYPDAADSIKAEPGSTIEYELVIKNEEETEVTISVEFDEDVTLIEPASLENISLEAGKSITVKVKLDVSKNYPVAKNKFELNVNVEAEFNGITGDVEEASVKNKIEKSSTTVLKNPEAKNIILVLDLSGSMNKGTNGKEDRIGALKTEAKKFVNKLQAETVGEINLTLVGIGADNKNGHISGTVEAWSGYPNADAFILGSYTLSDWNKLLTKIDGLVAYGGTNITGSMKIVNKILTGSDYKTKINYDENAKDYVVILTDGANGPNGDVPINGTEATIVAVRNNADYLAAIGFGSEASDTSKRAYKDLVSITNDVSKVYSAAKQADLDKAFSDIANHIGKEQSVGGYADVDVTAYNGNIYPIKVTHKVGSTEEELFRIIHPVTNVTWDNEGTEVTTPISISENEVKIDLSGTAFSEKEDLKIIIGEGAAKYIATFILNNGEEAIIKTQEVGSVLEAPIGFTNETYEFLGWTPEVPATMPAEDVEYEAMWNTGVALMMVMPPITEELEKDELIAPELNENELVKLELPKINLEKLELAKKDKLVNTKLNREKLSKLELNKDKLVKTELNKLELPKANLEKNELVKTELPKANLEKVELVKTELSKVNLEKVEVKKEELAKVALEEVKLIGKKPTLLPELEKTEE